MMSDRAVTAWDKLESAANQGDVEAQFYLGIRYVNGFVPKDEAQAFKWFQKAALQGYTLAHYALSLMYIHGEGIPKNDIQAYAWMNMAAASDLPDAGKIRDRMALTLEQKAEAQKLSAELFEKIQKTYQTCHNLL